MKKLHTTRPDEKLLSLGRAVRESDLHPLQHRDAVHDYLPFPTEFFPSEIGEVAYGFINTWLDKAPILPLPIKSLIATQIDVTDAYWHHAMHDGTGSNDPIKVVNWNGKNYIIDGHHRSVADYELGKQTVPGHYLAFAHCDLTELEKCFTPDQVEAYLKAHLVSGVTVESAPVLSMPFPMVNGDTFLRDPYRPVWQQMCQMVKAAPVVSMALNSLEATQTFIDPAIVAQYRVMQSRPIEVVGINGVKYINNGHHRAIAAFLNGDPRIDAWYAAFDYIDPADLPQDPMQVMPYLLAHQVRHPTVESLLDIGRRLK